MQGFDHDKFAEDCNNSSTDMMISYNSDQLVTNRFMTLNGEQQSLILHILQICW